MARRTFLVDLDVDSELPDDLKSFADELTEDIEAAGWHVHSVKPWGAGSVDGPPTQQTVGDFF